VRGEEDEEEKVKIAASYLSGVAKTWFVGKYALLDALPPFAEFIDAFKAQFSRADDARQLRVSLERIRQGTRNVLEYSEEFQMIHAQMGPTADLVWVHHRFIEWLHDDVRKIVGPNIDSEDTIDQMTSRAQRAYEFVVRENARRSCSSVPNATRSWGTQAPVPTGTRAPSKKLKDISPKEFENLRDSSAYFICRRPGHMAHECPSNTRKKEERAWKPVIKREVLDREMPIAEEDESETEPSMYRPVPSIHVPVKVKETLIEALIDCGAEGDFISERVVKEKKIPTVPIKPIRVRQALQKSEKSIVNQKVRSHIHFTNKEYTSKEEVDLLVAPLNTDVTLGMPTLQREKIMIDTANHDIITPKTKAETKNKSSQPACLSINHNSNLYPPQPQ